MKIKTCNHETHAESNEEKLSWALEQVREKSLRITNPRKEILAVLVKAVRPLSSDEVFGFLKKGSIDLVTVYRSLTSLEEIGLLRRHDLGDNVRRYEISQEQNHHHHYITCRSCGDVEAFEGCAFERAISKTLERKGYKMIQHTLDVQALCAKCSKES